ncbi:hypothetical protein [Paenibacillus rhizoplanae]|uniref:Condensation domain-containing protein n=1 Tax=Paenibacillus rhizoplanae TaxID=1917181 RepID=A0ABW5FJN4_9BACL
MDKDKTVTTLVNEIYPLESFEETSRIIIPSTVIKFKIDYDLNDDIRNYADYIMDFDTDKRSIYLEYSFEVNQTSLVQALERDYDKLKSRFEKIDDRDAETPKVKVFKEKN